MSLLCGWQKELSISKEQILQNFSDCKIIFPSQDRERSRKLQQLKIPILVSEECQKYYQNHSGGVSQRMFCAGFPAEEDKDSCTVSRTVNHYVQLKV